MWGNLLLAAHEGDREGMEWGISQMTPVEIAQLRAASERLAGWLTEENDEHGYRSVKGGATHVTSSSDKLISRDALIARLRAGETVSFREGGNSMTPRIKSRQKCTYEPITQDTRIAKGDIVYCRVRSSYFTHLVTGIKGDQFQISNNHGHVNGWITREDIFGRVIQVEG